MITLKGNVLTFTGKDLKSLEEVANRLGKTPEETVIQALEYRIKQDKLIKKSQKKGKK